MSRSDGNLPGSALVRKVRVENRGVAKIHSTVCADYQQRVWLFGHASAVQRPIYSLEI